MRVALLDTGPLVAYLDAADGAHEEVTERLAVLDVFTLDRRGFSTYRTRQGKAFRNLVDAT